MTEPAPNIIRPGTREHAAAITEGRHPGVRDALQWLTFAHLPEQLRDYSAPFYAAAVELVRTITTDSPELTTSLNKLIEAKDSAMRAGIKHDTGRAGSVPRPQEVVLPPLLASGVEPGTGLNVEEPEKSEDNSERDEILESELARLAAVRHEPEDPEPDTILIRQGGPDGPVVRTITRSSDTSDVSDGYHTFGELYDHRRALTAALCRAVPMDSWISRAHHPDDDPMFEGYFIVGVDLPGVGTITYHYKLHHLPDFQHVIELPHAPKWDGAPPSVTVDRLLTWATR